jgi:hypothetical protein
MLALILAQATATASPPLPLGVTYAGWKGAFKPQDAKTRLEAFKKLGFPIVSFVPAFAYVGRNQIDLTTGPSFEDLGQAIEQALRMGFQVVVKPHLNAPIYGPGYDRFGSDNESWRAECPWRGYFDLDPMTQSYREGVVLESLRMLKAVFARLGAESATVPKVRLELGVELMNSIVAFPTQWVSLLGVAKVERQRLGLTERVLLSHNFSHHIEIPGDEVDRMDRTQRKALATYIKRLDALAISQYMDLTVAVPLQQRPQRPPTATEVSTALVQHEQDFQRVILKGALNLKAKEIPPIHIGEFGVGRGGLKHPNLWGGATNANEQEKLNREIVLGAQGLVEYLQRKDRLAQSAVLWVTGMNFDIFGWGNPSYATPEAATVFAEALAWQIR